MKKHEDNNTPVEGNPFDIVKQEILPINFRPATEAEREKIVNINIDMFIEHTNNSIRDRIERRVPGVVEKTPAEIDNLRETLKSKWANAQFLIHEVKDDFWTILILTRLEYEIRTGEKFIKYHTVYVDSNPDFSIYQESSF